MGAKSPTPQRKRFFYATEVTTGKIIRCRCCGVVKADGNHPQAKERECAVECPTHLPWKRGSLICAGGHVWFTSAAIARLMEGTACDGDVFVGEPCGRSLEIGNDPPAGAAAAGEVAHAR